MKDICAVVLCGGMGTRLRSEIGEEQKVMVSFEGRPFLDYILEQIVEQGVHKVVLCAGYKSESVKNIVKRYPDVDIVISIENEPLGTGGAIKNAETLISSDKFFVFNGDSFCKIDLKNFFEFHLSKDSLVSMAVAKVEDSKDYGRIILDPDQSVVSFEEKNQRASSPYVNAGVYCFSKEVLDVMPQGHFSLEKDLFPRLTGMHTRGFILEKSFLDIGTPQRFKKAKELIERQGRFD
ncbi:MAG: nucleotidyltransferase family protein [Candidatus Omnitrophica bacterium]|nr:nucleotidyltransferase family protein [Candidatus Omnitrophota bacterium]